MSEFQITEKQIKARSSWTLSISLVAGIFSFIVAVLAYGFFQMADIDKLSLPIFLAVAKHPEQYFWFHRRWKTAPKADEKVS